ncbi:MAG TPA: HAMP domain-containing sensor histidine kinase, partial [Gemmatimonadales bacterium]|nr:HAMP domain-containing sensor histidine kinase [Gemmatimonadales bacterium]
LSVSLALFFVLPTVSFAAWSYLRLEDEFRSARALLLQRTLRDAAAALARDTSDAATAVAAAARQVDAPLLYSVGGVVTAVSDPVLTDLGLVEHLVPSDVHVRLAYGDELEVVAGEPSERALVGYRLLARSGGADPVVLAAPEPLADATLRRREADLGIAVLVAVLLGVVAALVLSSIASRALARPLHSLRQSALAVGAGTPPPAGQQFPGELEPIHAALLQAARDVEKGRHAQRVLAWGEMARQVAHEIKNPLTPIRLGIQHLLRLDREKPGDLSATLRTTGPRLLNEIDRLDSIARAFSRFAAPSAPEVPLEPVDVASVAHDVAQLYGAGGAVLVRVDAPEPEMLRARARRDELSEVLINLCDNACNAGARRITVTARRDAGKVLVEVSDDGRGIPDDVLPRIFEPRFSTTTSGSGLGLAIARRLVESWGGAIAVGSTGPHGTTVRVTLEGE